MVVFDASILLFVLEPDANASVDRAGERVDYLIERLSKAGEGVVVPTPALSECLVNAAAAAPSYVAAISRSASFRVASFDERAAIEAAAQIAKARARGHRKGGNPEASKTKIKFDRQIVAIAVVEGASAIYSDDGDVCGYAKEVGIEAYKLADLPLRPGDLQIPMNLNPPETDYED